MTTKNGMPTSIIVISIVSALLLGGLLGWFAYQYSHKGNYSASLQSAMELVRRHYVDSVDMREISQSLIPDLLHRLDPHSDYLTREMSREEMQRLEGRFYGVGITFNTIIDTPVVVEALPGGPAFRAGILPGDRLLAADDSSLLVDGMTSEDVQKQLKGARGSVVKLQILRDGEPLSVGVTRDDVPMKSIHVVYMLDDTTGLLKINNWGRTTHHEFLEAMASLLDKGMKSLVIDLRDNVGGYMQSAVLIANEFLHAKDLIVYSQGRTYPKEEYFADGRGLFQDIPLAILVNEFSASSSEIFAGSMQDHDRALIIGRRTFGKGLIQQPFFMPDSSEIRLTVARYYMPSGRSLQKKYTLGNNESYQRDLANRVDTGEIYHLDSSFYETAPRYTTEMGRTVYGENGIMPDFFVSADSLGFNSYYLRILESGFVPEFAFRYSDSFRNELSLSENPIQLWKTLRQSHNLVEKFVAYASEHGLDKRPALLWECYTPLEKLLSAQVAQFIFGDQGFYEIYFSDDNTILVAKEALESEYQTTSDDHD